MVNATGNDGLMNRRRAKELTSIRYCEVDISVLTLGIVGVIMAVVRWLTIM